MMLEELQRRNFAKTTIQYYVRAVEDFAAYFGKPPDRLNHEHFRHYQAYLLNERKTRAKKTSRLSHHGVGGPGMPGASASLIASVVDEFATCGRDKGEELEAGAKGASV
jgi:hypothetical protein